jgi:beta-xylosidase
MEAEMAVWKRWRSPAAGLTYRNPIVRGMNPDPSIVRVGSTYYFEWFEYKTLP